MDPLPAPTTARQRTTRHKSRSSNASSSRSSTRSRANSPSASLHLHGAPADVPSPLCSANPVSRLSKEPSCSDEAHSKRRRDITPSPEVELAPYVPQGDEQEGSPAKKRRTNYVPKSPEIDVDHSKEQHEFQEGSSRTHIEPQTSRRTALKDEDSSVETISDLPELSPPQSPFVTQSTTLSQSSLEDGTPQPTVRTSETDVPNGLEHTLDPLSSYNCPICFSPPCNATLTPCGHVCCGDCLFAAVKTSIERSVFHGPVAQRAKCPVCRAPIPGWDGKGGGVIGLKPRALVPIGNREAT